MMSPNGTTSATASVSPAVTAEVEGTIASATSLVTSAVYVAIQRSWRRRDGSAIASARTDPRRLEGSAASLGNAWNAEYGMWNEWVGELVMILKG